MINLVCPECRRENEPQRIYCHDCGARLDRTALAKAKVEQVTPEDEHRRLRSMFDPHRDRMRRMFFKIARVILGALATAALIQMLLPPDVPPRTKSIGVPPEINFDLERAAGNPAAAPLSYTDEQANAYLAYVTKSKHASLSSIPQFERATVSFQDGACGLTVERSLYGFSFYTGATYQVALQNGAINVATKAGRIGRLPVHPAIMNRAGFLFRDLARVLEREQKSIAKMGAIEFRPKTVLLTPHS